MSFPVQQIGLKKLEKQSVPNTVINDTLGATFRHSKISVE